MRRVLAFAIAVLLAGAAPAAACTPRTSVADLEDEVMCPVCGTSLAVARDAPLAQRERALIARLVRRCWSKPRIEAMLVAQFGPGVLALPPDRGLDASAYLVPAGGGLTVAVGVAWLLVRWRRRPQTGTIPSPGGAPSAADALRLEAELDRLR
jgi:cytochrome c-type biogenesis protein CcmH